MEIRPYHIQDLDEIESRQCDVVTSDASTLGSIGWSFLSAGEVVAIVGIITISPGVANIWAVVTDLARGSGTELTKKCRELIDNSFEYQELHRIQAMIRPEIEENGRWIKMLGFVKESTLIGVTPEGNDLDMYVQVRLH